MICPHCKKETPTIFRVCQNCKADLEEYRSMRNKSIEGTGEDDIGGVKWFEALVLKFGLIGGLILIILSLIVFFVGKIKYPFDFYPYFYFTSYFLLLIGGSGLINGIRRKIKRTKLKKLIASGKILD